MDGEFRVHTGDRQPMYSYRSVNRAIFTLVEILPALICAVITTFYALRHENPADNDREELRLQDDGELRSSTLADPTYPSWVLDPGPGLMLGSCLVYGCCVSSYSYRRQDLDTYQTAFFVLAICGACTLGLIYDSSANLIMLGYIPWALCLAMAVSALSHAIMRLCSQKNGLQRSDPEDKAAW